MWTCIWREQSIYNVNVGHADRYLAYAAIYDSYAYGNVFTPASVAREQL